MRLPELDDAAVRVGDFEIANVTQTVPVQGRKQYALRLHFRSEGLVPEKKEAGSGLRRV